MRNYTVADGLPSNKVYQMLQDSAGNMWFATESGLSRFDGVEWRNFSSEDGLYGHDILSLLLDSQGRLWLLNIQGVAEYYLDGEFHNAFNDPELKGGTVDDLFFTGIEDKDGNIWLSSQKKVLCIPHDGPIRKISMKGGREMKDNLSFYKNPEGDILLSSRTTGSFNLTKERVVPTVISGPEGMIARLYQAPDGTIYKTMRDHLYVFRNDSLIRRVKFPFSTGVIDIQIRKDSSLILGTWDGMYIFDHFDTLLTHGKLYLPGKSTTFSFLDREGNHWISTLDHGLHLIPSAPLSFFTPEDGFPDDEPTAITKDAQGRVWIGFPEGKSGYIEGDRFIPIDLQLPKGLQGNQCMNIIDDRAGGLWFSYERDIVNWNNGKLNHINWGSKDVFLTDEGQFLVAYYSGLIIFPNPRRLKEISEMERYSRVEHMHSHQFPERRRIKKIVQSPRGSLFGVSFNGVFKIGDSTFFPISPKIETNNLSFLSDGTPLISTNGNGLLIMFPDTNMYISQKSGLSSNYCNVTEAVNDSTLWVGTSSGLDKIDLLPGNRFLVTNYLTRKVNDLEVIGDSTWIASGVGLAVISNQTDPLLTCPSPFLNQINVNNNPVDLYTNPNLSYNQNNVSFGWTVRFFQDPSRVRYRFKLQGAKEIWHQTKEPYISYSTLPPGQYSFQLQASIDGRNWVPMDKPLTFSISTPFWENPWLRFSLVGLIVVIAVMVYRRRIKVVSQRSRLQAESLKQKEIALRAQMNPHFVFNAMNSIQQYILLGDQEGALIYLSKFSKLIRMILENSRRAVIPMEQELEALKLYLELEKLRVGEKFNYEIRLSEDMETDFIVFPGLILQPLAENAIWHGILPKRDEGGRLLIDIRHVGNEIIAVVEDNGIGRKKAAEQQVQDPRNAKSSLGLENIRDRLKIFGKTHNKEVEMLVEDKYSEDGKASGTKVILRFPYSEVNG